MRRCPYCAEKTITLYEQLGGIQEKWGTHELTDVQCPNCMRYSKKVFGKLGNIGQGVLLVLLPIVLLGAVVIVDAHLYVPFWVYGLLLGLFVALMPIYYFFVYFDKDTKAEREADARLTFAVTEKKAPRVKKWRIYLIRFPKRGTNEFSPVLYGMVCGKSSENDERTLTLRVIRADNMDLPDADEPAWLITDSNKVMEGKIIAVTPRKKI